MNIPTETEILKALEQSGYLFEQDVATRLESLGFHVETNRAYLDQDLGKSREIDVRAIREVARDETNHIQIIVELLVECKSFGTPLVFLERQKNVREQNHAIPTEYLFPVKHYSEPIGENTFRTIPAFEYLKLSNIHYYFRETKKATQFSKIIRKGKEWEANHDGIYDTLLLPMAKVLDSRKLEIKKSINSPTHKYVWLFFPMVVLFDHLYALDISDQQRQLEKRGRVSFVRHIESGSMKGYYLTDFVTYSYLNEFVLNEIGEFYGEIVKLLESNPQVLINSFVSGK